MRLLWQETSALSWPRKTPQALLQSSRQQIAQVCLRWDNQQQGAGRLTLLHCRFLPHKLLTSLSTTEFILQWNNSFYQPDFECLRLTRASVAVSVDINFGISSGSQRNPSPVMCLKPSRALSQATGNKPVDVYLLNALCSVVSQRMASCSPHGEGWVGWGIEQLGLAGDIPAYGRRVGTRWSWRFFPTQIILVLWF